MCNPKPRHSRSNLEGRCISFLKFRLSHGRLDAEMHDTTQARRRGAARFASTRVSCGINRPTSWRIAAMVAHKAATRRRIAWVAVTIAGGRPLPRNFQCCSPRSSNSVEIAAPTCTLYSPSSKSRSKSSPLAAPSQPGTGRKLAIALDRLRLKTRQPALCRYAQRAPDASLRSLIT